MARCILTKRPSVCSGSRRGEWGPAFSGECRRPGEWGGSKPGEWGATLSAGCGQPCSGKCGRPYSQADVPR